MNAIFDGGAIGMWGEKCNEKAYTRKMGFAQPSPPYIYAYTDFKIFKYLKHPKTINENIFFLILTDN
jgi:hypothetical protein